MICIFLIFQCLKKCVTNFPITFFACSFLFYFGGVCFGFFSSTYPPHPEIWRPHFKVRILQPVPKLFSAKYTSCFPWSMFLSVTHLALFFCVCMWLYYFVCLFSRLSQATCSVFYYTQLLFHCVPLMLPMETLMEEEIMYWVRQPLGQCLTRHLQVLAVQLETKVKKTSLFFYFKRHWLLSLKFEILFFFPSYLFLQFRLYRPIWLLARPLMITLYFLTHVTTFLTS